MMTNWVLREALQDYAQTAQMVGYWLGCSGITSCEGCRTVQYADADASGGNYGQRRCHFHSCHAAHAVVEHRAAAWRLGTVIGTDNVTALGG